MQAAFLGFVLSIHYKQGKVIKVQDHIIHYSDSIINVCNDECDYWQQLYFKAERKRMVDSLSYCRPKTLTNSKSK